MDEKFIPSLTSQKVNRDNFDYFYDILPCKAEIIDGEIYFNEGEIRAEELLKALIYYIGVEKTVQLFPDKRLWLKAMDKAGI